MAQGVVFGTSSARTITGFSSGNSSRQTRSSQPFSRVMSIACFALLQVLGLQRLHVRAMAVCTFRRRLLVNDHRFFPNQPGLSVTFAASHLCVASLQRKVRSRIVIERRRHPALRIMTIRTRGLAGLCKLSRMGVLVAIFANLRSALELHLFPSYRYLVTRSASHRAVRAKQGKLCPGMVKAVYICPGTRVVAGFAAQQHAVNAPLRHSILKFPVMRVRVASRAGHILEAERKNFVGSPASSHLMAIGARYRGVCPG